MIACCDGAGAGADVEDRRVTEAGYTTTQPTVAFGNSTSVPRFFARTAGLSAPRGYDIMPDGRLIGLIAPQQAADAAGTAPPEIRVVLNWTEELKRLVPVK